MNLRAIHLLAAFFVFAAARECLAYGFSGPKPCFVGSPDGLALLRIDPGDTGDSNRHPAHASVYKVDAKTGSYQLFSRFYLRNPSAPKNAVISNDARFIVTVDDWEPYRGATQNSVVVYRGTGEILKWWSLEDIFSNEELRRFKFVPSDVPDRIWHGEAVSVSMDDAIHPVFVWIPWSRDLPWHVGLSLNLSAMTFYKQPERDSDR